MTSYILRNIDPQLWKRIKAKADRQGRTIRVVMLNLLITWLGTPDPEEYGSIYERAKEMYKER